MCHTAPASVSANSTSARFDNRSEDELFEVSTKDGDERYLSTFGRRLLLFSDEPSSYRPRPPLVERHIPEKRSDTTEDVFVGAMAFDGVRRPSVPPTLLRNYFTTKKFRSTEDIF